MYNTNYQIKTAKAKIPMYDRSNWYSLSDAYTSYSYRKERAWDYCVHKMIEYNGMGLKVISRNTNFFTAGFVFYDEETGDLMFYYITANYDCIVPYTL